MNTRKALGVLLIMVLSMTTGCLESVSKSESATMWSEEKAWEWYNNQDWLVGCNYLPSTASNQFEMWQAETFDPETIDRELKWASGLGFNIVRVFLHDMMWEQDSKGFVKRIDKFLEIADKHNIKVMPILLDSCWNPISKLGPQPEPTPHVHNSTWVQSPHIDTLKDPASWGKLKDYIQGIVKRYRNDDRVLIWDIYNEPGNPNSPTYTEFEAANKGELSLMLMKKAFKWAREMKPTQPLTACVWTGDWRKGKDIPALNKFALENSDLNQFHVYHGPEITRDWINTLKEYNRPIICGEYMARTTGCTFESILPIFKENRVAAINWGFVAGRSQTNYPWESWTKKYTAEPEVWFHDILRPDGTPYRKQEVEFIKNITKQSCDPISGDKSKSVKSWKNYKGWNSMCLSNGIAELNIVPEIGGRVVQYKLNDKEFFWINPALAGKMPTATGLDPDGGWLNYGGDKLWPAPQGWDNDQEWPGPPDAVLDGQPHVIEQLPDGQDGSVAVRLTSGKDLRSGISFSRVIRLHPHGTRVSIEATMTNVDNKPRRWGIWAHTQLNAASANGKNPNSLMNAYCPINPNSHFPKGYNVIFGEKDNPSFQAIDNKSMVKVNYQYRVGKIGVDSDAGWVATIDGQTGDVFVHRFVYEPDKKYPDGSSVEFWHNGVGSIFAYNETMVMPDDPQKNAYVFESEVLSPFAKLNPGQSYTWNYEWFSTQVGGDFPVVDCTPTGVICQPLQANKTDKVILLEGRFGVFYKGSLVAHYLDASGKQVGSEVLTKVNPLKTCVLSHVVKLVKNAESISLHLHDAAGKDLGLLSMTSL